MSTLSLSNIEKTIVNHFSFNEELKKFISRKQKDNKKISSTLAKLNSDTYSKSLKDGQIEELFDRFETAKLLFEAERQKYSKSITNKSIVLSEIANVRKESDKIEAIQRKVSQLLDGFDVYCETLMFLEQKFIEVYNVELIALGLIEEIED